MSTMQKLSEAIRLWPRPDEAPEVPPEAVLHRFLNDPASIEPDLAAQIRSSPNCARALETLRRQPEVKAGKQTFRFFEQLRTISAAAKTDDRPGSVPWAASGQRDSAVAEPGGLYTAPTKATRQVGSVWTTRKNVEIWTGAKMAHRFTYRPLTVALVQEAREMPWDDTLYRAIPLTPTLVWPNDWLASDELQLNLPGVDRFAAHLWLEYPVSGCQLDRCLGQLPESERENLEFGLTAYREGLPLPPDEGGGRTLEPEQDTEILLERERLHACAAWLAATADARREWWESRPEGSVTMPKRTCFTFPREYVREQALAAATPIAAYAESEFVLSNTGMTLLITLDTDKTNVSCSIYDSKDNPSTSLDGAVITTPDGVSPSFKEGQTRLPLAWISQGFRFRLPNGDYISLTLSEGNAPQ